MGGKGSKITKDFLRNLFQYTPWVGKPTHVSSSETLKKLWASKFGKKYRCENLAAHREKVTGNCTIFAPRSHFVNEISKEPAARLNGKLSCSWLIILVTMATPISSHVKDKNSIFTARDEDMIF